MLHVVCWTLCAERRVLHAVLHLHSVVLASQDHKVLLLKLSLLFHDFYVEIFGLDWLQPSLLASA